MTAQTTRQLLEASLALTPLTPDQAAIASAAGALNMTVAEITLALAEAKTDEARHAILNPVPAVNAMFNDWRDSDPELPFWAHVQRGG